MYAQDSNIYSSFSMNSFNCINQFGPLTMYHADVNLQVFGFYIQGDQNLMHDSWTSTYSNCVHKIQDFNYLEYGTKSY